MTSLELENSNMRQAIKMALDSIGVPTANSTSHQSYLYNLLKDSLSIQLHKNLELESTPIKSGVWSGAFSDAHLNVERRMIAYEDRERDAGKELSFAPWDQEQVRNLQRFQHIATLPYLCGNCDAVLIPNIINLKCHSCAWYQTWAHLKYTENL